MQRATSASPAAFAAATILVCMVAAGLFPLIHFTLTQGGSFKFDAYLGQVLRFTLLQAGLSTLISLAIGLSAALTLANRSFPGRSAFMGLLALPQAMPAVVVVIAFATLFGANGWFANGIPLYGLGGIVLVHVFFNAPLATRYFLTALEQLPTEQRRLADQLGFGPWQRFRHLEWFAVAPSLPGLAALIFFICAGSFATVLILGGPQATTLEVAIYQSLRLDFDVTRALSLSAVQVALCALLVWLAGSAITWSELGVKRRTPVLIAGQISWPLVATICVLLVLMLPAVLALVADGVGRITLSWLVLQAVATSAGIATVAACIAVCLALPLASAQVARRSLFWTMMPLLGLIIPPAVLATGWFLATVQVGGSRLLGLLLVIGLNAIMALPFAVAALAPAIRAHQESTRMLTQQLGLSGWNKLKQVDLPALQKPMTIAGLTAFLLSLGDLTAITLFGSQGLVTLPSLIASQMSNYRSADALGTALLLAGLCFVGAWLVNKLARDT